MCLRNKVLETLGYVRNFTYLDAANITSKQKSDMAKVAIKNMNITSFGGIYYIMDVFQSWALKNLPNLYWVNVEVAAKHSVMEVFLCFFILPHWFGWVAFMIMQEPRTRYNPHING